MKVLGIVLGMVLAGCATTGSQQEIKSKFEVGQCVTPTASTLAQVPPQLAAALKAAQFKIEAIGSDYYVVRLTTNGQSAPQLMEKGELDTQAEVTECSK